MRHYCNSMSGAKRASRTLPGTGEDLGLKQSRMLADVYTGTGTLETGNTHQSWILPKLCVDADFYPDHFTSQGTLS